MLITVAFITLKFISRFLHFLNLFFFAFNLQILFIFKFLQSIISFISTFCSFTISLLMSQ